MPNLVETAQFAEQSAELIEKLKSWVRDYVAKENEQVRRPEGSQAICPFAGTSLRSGQLKIISFPEIDGSDARILESVALEQLRNFSGCSPMATLILAFPNFQDDRSEVLDAVQQKLELMVLNRGLILAQVHKNETRKGLYNQSLGVFAPCDFLKIRHMVVQDIIFLGNCRERFEQYCLRFGSDFAGGGPVLPIYIANSFRAATARFGEPLRYSA